jgi:hypothetical protein
MQPRKNTRRPYQGARKGRRWEHCFIPSCENSLSVRDITPDKVDMPFDMHLLVKAQAVYSL